MNMRNIVYIGDSLGIENSAMQEHALNISRIFKKLNYNVVFVSNRGWRPGDLIEKFETESHEPFHCYYSETKPLPNDTYRKWYRRYSSLFGKDHWKIIYKVLETYSPEIIIFYGYICMKKVMSYSKKHGIKLLVERTDWFTKDFYSSMYDRYIWCRYTDKCIIKLSTKADGIIVVSDYFNYYYKGKATTLQIPALCSLSNQANYLPKDILTMVYAGSPGNKDLLLPVIDAVNEINRDQIRIQLHIVGIRSYKEITNEDVSKRGIFFYGKQVHDKAIEIISNSDISVLLRRNEMYAIAGFSTKLAESMWLGVPVLCNMIGGTDSCITDNVNGFLVKEPSTDEVYRRILEIIQLDKRKLEEIKRNACQYAHNHFSYINYVEQMKSFLDEIDMKKTMNIKT